MRNSPVLFASTSLLLAAAIAACSDSSLTRATERTDAGPDATLDEADGGPMTDPCIDNPTALACLDESKALFVSNPNGNDQDAAAGTKKNPFKTINAALAKIDAKRRRIYVCEGAYFEDLALNASHSSLSIFGGLDCAWNAAPAIKPVIGASANPLKIDGTAALAIADIAVVAKDAATGSSIAAFVNGGDTTFKRVKLSAGKGSKGDVGVRADFGLPTVLAGHDGATGGGEKLVTCPDGTVTKGGKGGGSGFDGESGSPGVDNKGTVGMCSASTGGGIGALGASRAPALGASKLGELTAQGWLPEPGKKGDSGGPGQGGGGGAGLGGGTGGSGGAGGCGGAGGGGGKGGGASIALLSFQARVQITDSVLQASTAGAGGAGASGQAGTNPGGPGGTRTPTTTACNGGTGGAGGTGALGGGGAGGISVGILSKGSTSTVDDSTVRAIAVGGKGSPGGDAGQKPGVDGVAQAVLDLN